MQGYVLTSARLANFRSGMLMLLGLSLPLVLFIVICRYVLGLPRDVAFDISMIAFMGITVIGLTVQMAKTYRQRGVAVLDCGRHPWWGLFALFIVICLFLGLFILIFESSSLSEFRQSILMTVMGLCYFPISFGHFRIHENGIWRFGALLRWKDISHYEWQETDKLYLCYETSSPWPWMKKGGFEVPGEFRDAFERAFEEHCPGKVVRSVNVEDPLVET